MRALVRSEGVKGLKRALDALVTALAATICSSPQRPQNKRRNYDLQEMGENAVRLLSAAFAAEQRCVAGAASDKAGPPPEPSTWEARPGRGRVSLAPLTLPSSSTQAFATPTLQQRAALTLWRAVAACWLSPLRRAWRRWRYQHRLVVVSARLAVAVSRLSKLRNARRRFVARFAARSGADARRRVLSRLFVRWRFAAARAASKCLRISIAFCSVSVSTPSLGYLVVLFVKSIHEVTKHT